MILTKLAEELDLSLRKESLTLHTDESKYAVPPQTDYNKYDEMFREYKISGGKIFTVMIRKDKANSQYWVRCGYKEKADSKYVGGLAKRDCTTYSETELIDHCKNHFNVILKKMGW